MNEAVLWKLADLAITAFQVGLERQVVVGKIKELEEHGKTPDELAAALKAMRDEAIDKL
jgi:hypothetical protein